MSTLDSPLTAYDLGFPAFPSASFEAERHHFAIPISTRAFPGSEISTF